MHGFVGVDAGASETRRPIELVDRVLGEDLERHRVVDVAHDVGVVVGVRHQRQLEGLEARESGGKRLARDRVVDTVGLGESEPLGEQLRAGAREGAAQLGAQLGLLFIEHHALGREFTLDRITQF